MATHRLLSFVALVLVGAAACGKPCAHRGGPVAGPADSHCAGIAPVTVDPAVCSQVEPVPMAQTGNSTGNSNATDANASSDYGATMYNNAGKDDDCKYAVSWSSSPICIGEKVSISMTASYLTTGAPVTGAAPRLDVFLNDTHPAPYLSPKVVELNPGTYLIDPIEFDASGQWTMRFHLFENCADADTSPHGHAAFYVNVP